MNGTILTKIGLAELLNAPLTNRKANWNKLVVGDGNGSEYIPTQDMTELKNEMWRGNITEVHEVGAGHLEFHAVIPADVGPFIIREAGLLNDKNQLVAIASVDSQNKVSLEGQSGTSNSMDFIIGILVDNAESIEVLVNPNLTIATQEYVHEQVEQTLKTVQDMLEAAKMAPITEERIKEIVGMEFSVGGIPTILNATSMSADTVERAIDDDPSNDPKVVQKAGALSSARIKEIIGE